MSSVWKKLLQYISCSDIINSSIFCKKKNISDESKGETTSKETVSASTFMSNRSTSDEILA